MQEISNGPIIFWGDHDIYCAVGYRTGPEIDPWKIIIIISFRTIIYNSKILTAKEGYPWKKEKEMIWYDTNNMQYMPWIDDCVQIDEN